MTTSVGEIIVRAPTKEDLPEIRPIIDEWVRDGFTGQPMHGEADEIEKSVDMSIAGKSNQSFLIAENEGHVLGIMGIQYPDKTMLPYTETEAPGELVTALVADESRGMGVGKLLVAALTQQANEDGMTELVVNSGPRYRETGWPFWKRMFGNPIAVAHDYYGQGADAMVWRQPINPLIMKETDPRVVDLQIDRGTNGGEHVFKFINNFEAKMPDGHIREMARSIDMMNSLIANPATSSPERMAYHSDRAQKTTYAEFFQEIDDTTTRIGLDKKELARLRELQRTGMQTGKHQEVYSKFVLPVYRELRIMGYSHYDLFM